MMLSESSSNYLGGTSWCNTAPYWHSTPWITSYNPYGYEARTEDVHYYYTYSPQVY